MPPLPEPRAGERLQIRNHSLPFSFWPMVRTTRRYGLQSPVFATNPWPVISRAVKSQCPAGSRPAALAFLTQAADFFRMATAGDVVSAKPLLLYYSFMNLAKAFILTRGGRSTLDAAQHGLSERMAPGGRELFDAYLQAYPNNAGSAARPNLFDDFLATIRGTGLAATTDFRIPHLMPQVVFGHRLWAEAADEDERFVGLEDIRFLEDVAGRSIWGRLYVFAHTLDRLQVSHQQFLADTGLAAGWREVRCDEQKEGHRLLCFEQQTPTTYTDRAADRVMSLVDGMRTLLWATVLTTKPYRRYYVYRVPVAEQPSVLPQLASIYALSYYLGSITRYRPHHFGRILDDEFESFVEGFVTDQPRQFLFLMATEFARREVVTAATV